MIRKLLMYLGEKRFTERLFLKIPPLLIQSAMKGKQQFCNGKKPEKNPLVRIYHLFLEKETSPLVMAFSGSDNLEDYFHLKLSSGSFVHKKSVPLPIRHDRELADIWFNTAADVTFPSPDYQMFHSYSWIRQVLNIHPQRGSLPVRLSKGLRNRDLKALDVADYTVTMDRTLASLELFYEDIYLPHIKKRFQGEDHVSSLREMTINVACGYVLLCYRNEKLWSGGIICFSKDTVAVPWLGVAGGETQAVTEGGLKAVYYEALKLAMTKKMSLMDFSNTRPFITDGVFNHKMRWGCAVKRPVSGKTPLVLGIQNSTRGIHTFFRRFPFIHFQGGSVRCLYGMDSVSDKELKKFRRLASCSDIVDIDVLGNEKV